MGELDERVDVLERKVAKLEKAVSILIDEKKHDTKGVVTPYVTKPNSIPNPVNSQVQQNVKVPTPNRETEGVTGWANYQPAQTVKKEKKSSDFEAFVGKNVFTIVASLLIFIGVIAFASVLLPYLTTEMKFILMCVASIGLTGFGYIMVIKRNTTFSVSLLACGLGTIYITLFTGNLYFKVVDTLILYIALFFWILAVFYLSKYKTLLFNIIGQAGILISLILCLWKALDTLDTAYVFYALIFVGVAEILYDILFRKTNYLLNTLCMLSSILILSYPIIKDVIYDEKLTFVEYFENFNGQIVAFLILSCLFLYCIFKNIWFVRQNKISSLQYGIVTIVSLCVFGFAMTGFEYTKIISVLCILYLITTFVITELLYFKSSRTEIITAISIIVLVGLIGFYYLLFDKYCISCLILLIPLALYVYKSNTTCPKLVFMVGLGITTIANLIHTLDNRNARFIIEESRVLHKWSGDLDITRAVLAEQNIIYYISCVVIALLGYFFFYKKRHEYKDTYGILVYLFMLCNILVTFMSMSVYSSYRFDEELFENISEIRCLCIMAIALFIQIMFRSNSFFDKTRRLFEQATYVVYFIANAFILLISVYCLYEVDDLVFAYLLATLMLIVLSTLNTSILLKEQNTGMAIYVGLKITLLIFIVMHVFDVQPIVSILLFVWAVACIVIGLKFTQKYLRIYALILSLVSAAKLILIDITYDNILSRAFSFIVCGLLCFVISYIYTRIEKSTKANVLEQGMTQQSVIPTETIKRE